MTAYNYRVSPGEGDRGSGGLILQAEPIGTPGPLKRSYHPSISPNDHVGLAAKQRIDEVIRRLGGTGARVQEDLVTVPEAPGLFRHHAGVAVGEEGARLFLASSSSGEVRHAFETDSCTVTFVVDARRVMSDSTPPARKMATSWLYAATVRWLSAGRNVEDGRLFRCLAIPQPQELALRLLASPGSSRPAELADRIAWAQDQARIHNEYFGTLAERMLKRELRWVLPNQMAQSVNGQLSIKLYVDQALRYNRWPTMKGLAFGQNQRLWNAMYEIRCPRDYGEMADMASQVLLAEVAQDGPVIVIGDSVDTEPLVRATEEFARKAELRHQMVCVDPLPTVEPYPLYRGGPIRIPEEVRGVLPGASLSRMEFPGVLNQVFVPGHDLS